MKKDIKYYMALPYKIEITPIAEEEGGGFLATLPELGSYAFVGDGDTPEEAISSLRSLQEELFTRYLAKGIAIPEPEKKTHDYSGRFVVRVPKSLHAALVHKAEVEDTSLNQYVLHLLSSSHILHSQERQISAFIDKTESLINRFDEIQFKFDQQTRKLPYVFSPTNDYFDRAA